MTTSGSYSQFKTRGGFAQQIQVPYDFSSNTLAEFASTIHELIVPISYTATDYVVWLPQGAFIDSFGVNETSAWTAGATIEVSSLDPKATAPSAPPTVSNVGTAGSSTFSYKYVALNGTSHSWSLASTAETTTTGNATLSAFNYNKLVLTAVTGATLYAIYRTAAPAGYELGLIGYSSALTFIDNGSLGAIPNTAQPPAAGDLLASVALTSNIISTPVFVFASSPSVTKAGQPNGVQQVVATLTGTTATAGSGYLVIKYSNTVTGPKQL